MPGKKIWMIPDMYYPSESSGKIVSHEALCVLNPSGEDAEISITLYFEDRGPMELERAYCGAERTNHIRMDQIKTRDGGGVPTDIPYAAVLRSNVDIAVQYSRADTRQECLAMMTTMAYGV